MEETFIKLVGLATCSVGVIWVISLIAIEIKKQLHLNMIWATKEIVSESKVKGDVKYVE